MPYAPATASGYVSVSAAVNRVTLKIYEGGLEYGRDIKAVTAGKSITLEAILDPPLSGRTIEFYWYPPGGGEARIGSSVTDVDGIARVSFTVPFFWQTPAGPVDVPCSNYLFRAVDVASRIYDQKSVWVQYPTVIEANIPTSVDAGQTITITGRLLYIRRDPTRGVLRRYPLPGRTLRLLLDGREIGRATTASDGSFRMDFSVSQPGRYRVEVVFDGDGGPYSGAAARAATTVATTVTSAITASRSLTAAALASVGALLLYKRG